MKVALLSNVTMEILAGMIGREHAVWCPPGFGAWMETALEPPKAMLDFAPDLICLLVDRKYGAFDASVQDVGVAVSRLEAAFPEAAVIVPDIARLAADFGDAFYDERMWKLGKMPFSIRALRVFGRLFTPKKVLAVDLDNTLWKGVVGEDGADGVVQDAALQGELRALRERGVLLAVLSKNGLEDGLAGMARMVGLRKEDFVAWRIDWNEKPDNLVDLARELNLGTDSFVFVDDNPAERAAMRARLPEVTVADFPPQLETFFPRRRLTAEDLCKTAMYRAEASRRSFAAGLAVEDYLAGLEICNDIHVARPDEAERIAQISQKTNQFNLCTNRYSESDIRNLMSAPDRLLVAVRSKDRFGDYGLVSFVLVTLCGKVEAMITDWAMSCRAMNRRIEHSVCAAVERMAVERGVCTLRAEYRRTPKNAPVADLYDGLGFTPVSSGADRKTYAKDLTRGRTSD